MPHETLWENRSSASTSSADTSDEDSPFATSSSPALSSAFSHHNAHRAGKCPCVEHDSSVLGSYRRRQSQQSSLAKRVMTSQTLSSHDVDHLRDELGRTLSTDGPSHALSATATPEDAPASPVSGVTPVHVLHRPAATSAAATLGPGVSTISAALHAAVPVGTGVSMALNDTPAHTAPNSPYLRGNHSDHSAPLSLAHTLVRNASGASTPRTRPTTLDIPGLTKSKVSPDGRIAPRDVGSKLVIVMVGLPARGKSYITKKLARYLNWLQHDTRIFNVGERRRVVAGGPLAMERQRSRSTSGRNGAHRNGVQPMDILSSTALSESTHPTRPRAVLDTQIMLNGETVQIPDTPTEADEDRTQDTDSSDEDRDLHRPDMGEPISPHITRNGRPTADVMDHNASFFDPDNKKASQIREQVARETLDELLDYILYGNGSVGILDATNSTIERRKMVMERIRERAGPDLNVLFLESRCVDQDLLEANMRLKLSGPDYKGMDPTEALEDFRKRVHAYEKAYVALGEYEERNNMPYIQMIDVGRKIISHQIKGFLMAQAHYYLLNFNLAPRQIWITRHGLSMDNISGKIGGDSDLAPEGHQFARSLARFMDQKRIEWDDKQLYALANSHFPPQPGDATPPNPHYQPQNTTPSSLSESPKPEDAVAQYEPKSFCVWTSMLNRSIQTAQYFNDEDYDTKQMRMLDELNAGVMEGLTYNCISSQFPEEYASRKRDKLHYRYPGPGGEGYLDIINRLRPVIVELERMTDHVLLVGHRSVSRVLLAYFRGLGREEVADLDIPLGVLYCLEPKPYGVDFKAYRWDKASEWFYEVPDFELRRAEDDMQ